MMKRTRQDCFPLCSLLLTAVLCWGCDNTVKERVEASVFLPDGYYRESNVADDMYIPCKMPHACRTMGAINYCTSTQGTWEPGKGHCGASQTCGRCLYPDLWVSDSSADPDLPGLDISAKDTAAADAGATSDAPIIDQAGDL